LRSKGNLALHIGLSTLLIGFVFTFIPWRDRLQPVGSDVWVTGTILEPLGEAASHFEVTPGAEIPDSWDAEWTAELRATGAVHISSSGEGPVAEWGLISVLQSLKWSTLLGVVATAVGGLLFGITRWWRLLKLCGAPTEFRTATRLTLLGLFFSLVLPGLTGGDLVKAAVAAKEHPGRRPAAVMAVGLDRVLGLWVLLWIGAVSSFTFGGDLSVVAFPLAALAMTSTVAVLVFCTPSLREMLGSKRLIRLIPKQLTGVIDALRKATSSPVELLIALVLSLGNHLCVGLGVFVVAHAVNAPLSYSGCLTASAVANSLSAVPLAPGGWGVGEAAFAGMFTLLGSSAAAGYAVSVSTRLCMTLISLLGGFVIWRSGGMSDWNSPVPSE
jgi:glycosyltransferase 2 family protein